ncbi:hypothetical protein BKM31_35140 [[Actinomadura] parvosata subsp. kistnae]|uniref:Uncharacterized protein n=1 Tax=[Actinomadura] parvosata subsp. kistnae TaxID=1909395 RepID=A0A1V0A721_9ACTN|nr:hypothetical protein BKM31_35140 [Nonomuraea sp. ATCC 55076]
MFGWTVTDCWQRARSLPCGVAWRARAPPCTGDDTAWADEQVQPVRPSSKPGFIVILAAEAGVAWKARRAAASRAAGARSLMGLLTAARPRGTRGRAAQRVRSPR